MKEIFFSDRSALGIFTSIAWITVGLGFSLSFVLVWVSFALLRYFDLLFLSESLTTFLLIVGLATVSYAAALRIAIAVLARGVKIAESQVRHFAIALIPLGMTGFLGTYLFFGILRKEMFLPQYLLAGIATLGIGIIVFILGIIWLDKISKPDLEGKRPIATKKDLAVFLMFLTVVCVLFFLVANKTYFDQQQRNRDTARAEQLASVKLKVLQFYQEQERYPVSLEEAGMTDISHEEYFYAICSSEEDSYAHIGVVLEREQTLILGWDRDYMPCDSNDFSGEDPVLDFIVAPQEDLQGGG